MAFNFELRVTKETEIVKKLPIVLKELESREMMKGLKELVEKMYDECENSREHGFRDCLKLITGVVSKDKTVQEVWLLKEKERFSRRSSSTPLSVQATNPDLVLVLHTADAQVLNFDSQKSLFPRKSESGRTTTRSSTNSYQSPTNHHTPPQTIIPPEGRKIGKSAEIDQRRKPKYVGRSGSLGNRPLEARDSNLVIDPVSKDRSPFSHQVPNYVFNFS